MATVEVLSQHERPIEAGAVRDLYDHLGWWPERTNETIAVVVEVGPAVGAWDGLNLVGFARAVTDGAFRAYIEDVAVHERYRGHGVGSKVVARLLELVAHVETVSLFCDSTLVGLYERHGFRSTPQVVMHRRNAIENDYSRASSCSSVWEG